MYPNGIETQTGSPITVNVALGEYEDQILHYKVTEHFIKKAGTIILMDCPCRTTAGCENHEVHLGSTYMGAEAAAMDLSKFPGARLATKDEALERERLAYENGLVPHLGKFRGDAAYFGVLDHEDELMSMCFCCPCCCINGKLITHGASVPRIFKRIEGLTVKVDEDTCLGCGKCLEVCVFKGM